MRVSIVKPDGLVGIDGRWFKVDLSALPGDLHAVQWDGTKGEVEWSDKDNTEIADLTDYQAVIDSWQALADAADNPPAPTNEEIITSYELAVQNAMDSLAQSWGYDNIFTAISYLNSVNAQRKADAEAANTWRDQVWDWAAGQKTAILADPSTLPATAADFVAGMPAAPVRPTA